MPCPRFSCPLIAHDGPCPSPEDFTWRRTGPTYSISTGDPLIYIDRGVTPWEVMPGAAIAAREPRLWEGDQA